MSEAIETTCPIRIEFPIAWGEMDSLGHINNAMYLRYFESGRIAYFERVGVGFKPQGPILASTTCDYLLPLIWPDTVRLETGVSKLGTSSFHMVYRLHSQKQGAQAARGVAVCVWYDFEKARSVPLPADVRQRIVALEHG